MSLGTIGRISLFVLAVTVAGSAFARREKSMIPDTDDGSHRGEIARAAQEKAGKRFADADADKDKRLSRDEVAAHYPYMAESWDRYDKDGDGYLTWQEFIGHDRWEQPSY